MHNPGNLYRAILPIHDEFDRYLLGAKVLGDQGREYCHRAACRTAEDGTESLGLLVVRAFVYVGSKCAITLAHGARCMDGDDNVQVLKGHLGVFTLVDMKDKSDVAHAFGRPGC
jgi:hypothetical protein